MGGTALLGDGFPGLDRAAALAAVDGDRTLLSEIAEAFLEEAPTLFERAESAFSRDDLNAVRSAAHGLKGAASSFGDHPAVDWALAIERAAKGCDRATVGPALNMLRRALVPLLRDLRAIAEADRLPPAAESNTTEPPAAEPRDPSLESHPVPAARRSGRDEG